MFFNTEMPNAKHESVSVCLIYYQDLFLSKFDWKMKFQQDEIKSTNHNAQIFFNTHREKTA